MTNHLLFRSLTQRVNHLLIAATLFTPLAALAEPFRFAVLPDTQIYSLDVTPDDEGKHGNATTNPDGTFAQFVYQTEWLAENAAELGIKHVIHLGDLVQNSNVDEQWMKAQSAMRILDDANVSYGVAVGNHDTYDNFANYLDYFGPQHYAHHEWYGYSDSGLSNYQIIPHEDMEILFLNVAVDTPDIEVAWAMDLLEKHHDKLAIISTHSYLWDYRFGYGRFGEKVKSGVMLGQSFGDHAQPFYETLVKSHPNVLMVMAGHVHGSLYRTDGKNGANLPVFEVLADYQDGRNGGDSYLRIYELDLDNRVLTASTYSPSEDRQRTIFQEFVESIRLINSHISKAKLPTWVNDLLLSRFKGDVVPNVEVVANHPEYLADPEYYEQLFSDLEGGDVPENFGHFTDWEGLWMLTFAKDRDNQATIHQTFAPLPLPLK